MYKERIEDSGDAVGPHGHTRFHTSQTEVETLESYAAGNKRYSGFMNEVLNNNKFDPVGKRKGACIKFFAGDLRSSIKLRDSIKGQIFESIAKGLDITIVEIETKERKKRHH